MSLELNNVKNILTFNMTLPFHIIENHDYLISLDENRFYFQGKSLANMIVDHNLGIILHFWYRLIVKSGSSEW
jgi:hypothetical protein